MIHYETRCDHDTHVSASIIPASDWPVSKKCKLSCHRLVTRMHHVWTVQCLSLSAEECRLDVRIATHLDSQSTVYSLINKNVFKYVVSRSVDMLQVLFYRLIDYCSLNDKQNCNISSHHGGTDNGLSHRLSAPFLFSLWCFPAKIKLSHCLG